MADSFVAGSRILLAEIGWMHARSVVILRRSRQYFGNCCLYYNTVQTVFTVLGVHVFRCVLQHYHDNLSIFSQNRLIKDHSHVKTAIGNQIIKCKHLQSIPADNKITKINSVTYKFKFG